MAELIQQLSWNEPEEIQKQAIEKLKNEKNLKVFIQPNTPLTGKSVWKNCSLILASKTDRELLPVIDDLLKWLQDMNWPGAWTILERLQKIPVKKYKKIYEKNMKAAYKELEELQEDVYLNSWVSNLEMINTHFKKDWFF